MPYCTLADVQRLLSSAGVDALSDYNGDGSRDADIIEDVIAQAADEIDMRLHERYDPAELATSSIINRWSIVLAAYFLCYRRGNPVPEPIANETDRILINTNCELDRIRDGKAWLPGIVPKQGFAPSFSNMIVDRRFGFPQKQSHHSGRHNRSANRPWYG